MEAAKEQELMGPNKELEQELGEGQGDMMALLLQERQENPPPQTTLGVTRRFIYDG